METSAVDMVEMSMVPAGWLEWKVAAQGQGSNRPAKKVRIGKGRLDWVHPQPAWTGRAICSMLSECIFYPQAGLAISVPTATLRAASPSHGQ